MSSSSPPILLAIETATAACSATLFHKGGCFSRYQWADRMHTQLILPMIQSLLDEASISVKALQAIAVGRGPGSFTGVRIAISVVQALSYGLNIPVYTVSTLEALAEQIKEEKINISVALDARMQEVYRAVYQRSEGLLTCIEMERLSAPESLIELHDIIAIGSGWDVYYPEKLKAAHRGAYPEAKSVGEIALRRWAVGELGVVAQDVLPVYLRNKIADKVPRKSNESGI